MIRGRDRGVGSMKVERRKRLLSRLNEEAEAGRDWPKSWALAKPKATRLQRSSCSIRHPGADGSMGLRKRGRRRVVLPSRMASKRSKMVVPMSQPSAPLEMGPPASPRPIHPVGMAAIMRSTRGFEVVWSVAEMDDPRSRRGSEVRRPGRLVLLHRDERGDECVDAAPGHVASEDAAEEGLSDLARTSSEVAMDEVGGTLLGQGVEDRAACPGHSGVEVVLASRLKKSEASSGARSANDHAHRSDGVAVGGR